MQCSQTNQEKDEIFCVLFIFNKSFGGKKHICGAEKKIQYSSVGISCTLTDVGSRGTSGKRGLFTGFVDDNEILYL